MDTAETRTVGTEADDSAQETTPELERGTSVGRYVILDQLGKGGMGVVYTAYDPDLDRQIALKILRSRSGRTSTEISRRLLREAQALAQLSHPNVIAVHDVGMFEGHVFLAMELVRGPNLRDWLQADKPPRHKTIDVFIQAGRGLAAAHAAGLIHRDFKPDNVIVGHDGRVRVLDFGLARATDSDLTETNVDPVGESRNLEVTLDRLDTASTITNMDLTAEHVGTSLLRANLTPGRGAQGTPAYMAPEQFRSSDVDSRADQYSFCTALFEALCGFRPIKARNVEALRRRVLTGKLEPCPPERHVPRHLQRILRRGLSLDPDDRFPGMDALLREMQRDTAAKIRRIGLLVVLALVIAAGSWFLARSQAASEPPCGRVADRLDEVWNPSVKQRMKQAFLSSGRAHAKQSLELTRGVIDAYANNWTEMRIEACEATRVRGDQSERLFDLRMQCLDRRLGQMRALIDLLSDEPSAEIVDQATTAAYRLPGLDLCADVTALTATMPPPEDPEIRRSLDALSKRLDDAEARESAGSFHEGLDEAESVLEQARNLGYVPLVAEALYRAGRLAEKTAASERAETYLLEAAELASRTNDDLLLAHIWTALLKPIGYTQGRFDEAALLARVASAAITRAGDKPRLRAELHSELGGVAYVQENNEQAYIEHTEALKIRRAELGDEHPDVAESLSHLGAVLDRQGKVDEAVDTHRQALNIRVKAFGPKHPDVGVSHLNMGTALVARGDYQQAHNHYVRALEILEETYGENHSNVGVARYNLGEYWWLQGNYDFALTHLSKALTIFVNMHGKAHPFTAYPLTGLGLVRLSLGQTDQAFELLKQAHEIRERTKAEPSQRSLNDFYLQCARWRLGERDPSIMVDARAAYAAYKQAPNHLVAEAKLMRQWLYSLSEDPDATSPSPPRMNPVVRHVREKQ